MAGGDKTDSHGSTPPPSYEELQLKGVAKTEEKDSKDEKTEEKKDGEEKTEEDIPAVGMLELVRLSLGITI